MGTKRPAGGAVFAPRQRTRRHLRTAALLALTLAMIGCSGQPTADSAHSSATATATSGGPSPTRSPSHAPALGADGLPPPPRPDCAAREDRFVVAAAGSGHQVGVLLLGPTTPRIGGVVLSPQSDDDICKWLPYARGLSTRYGVALVDYGVTGRAAPSVAVRVLRRAGVRRVVLAGASLGGAYALADAHDVRPQLAGVMSFSGETILHGRYNVDARPGIRAWRGPLLVLGSVHDGLFNAADAQFVARLHPGPETVVTVPGNLHGVDLLTGPEKGRVRAAVEAFLARVATSRKHSAR